MKAIFNPDIYDRLDEIGQGNPFEGLELSPADRKALDTLSGAENRKMVDELEELRGLVGINETTGLLLWKSTIAQRQLEADFAEAGRRNEDIYLMYFDVDTLKYLNDKYNYLTADEVLKTIPVALKEVLQAIKDSIEMSLRRSDSLYSFGVDEFLCYLYGAKAEKLPQILERIREKFDEKVKELVEQGKIPSEMADEVSFSGSVVKVDPYKITTSEDKVTRVEYANPKDSFVKAQELGKVAKKTRNTILIEGDHQTYQSRRDIKIDMDRVKASSEENSNRY